MERSIALSTAPSKPLRADARRNHERILAAAAAAFAAGGLEAQIEDIARSAGVGVGTVYRHFPTKDALVAALAAAHFERLAGIIEAACEERGDAWEALSGALWRCAETTYGDVALCEVIAGRPGAVAVAAAGQERLRRATGRLIDGARAQGTIRDDATVHDVATIMCGFGHVAAAQRAGGQMDARRYLTIALDGLRAR